MDISDLHTFLLAAKSTVDTAVTNNHGDTYVVLGNEAADLDSVVSTLVTAFYSAHCLAKEEKENKLDGQQSFVFPVINCTREDLALRTEVIFFLKDNGIRLELLICKDEIDLVALLAGGKLQLTLVDHNVLAATDACLQNCVVRVIDHHARERPLGRRDIIEPVGSCCTLVAEMVLGHFDKDYLICRLLYGTILLDTINLSTTAQRATKKDINIILELENTLSKISDNRFKREDIYSSLIKARSDISQLSPEQLLRKDCKLLRTPEISIAVPAVPILTKKFLDLPNAIESLKICQRFHRCSAIVVMGFEVSDTSDIRRDIIIFSDNIHKAKQVCTPMENCENLQLQFIKQITEPQVFIWLYEQNNVGLSRKFILPFLVTHFEVKTQNQLDLDSSMDSILLHGEMSPNPNRYGSTVNQIPSISYSSVQNLGLGDPISHGGSSQSSAYNSCPYTPQNSCAEPADGFGLDHYFLPSFNSREMIEKIELKRHKLRGYEKCEDDLKPGSSYPFTPKNSYVESTLDSVFEHSDKFIDRRSHEGNIHAIDSEVLLRKLKEKRRGDRHSSSNSNSSSKSQSLTKLNMTEDMSLSSCDMTVTNTQLSPTGHVSLIHKATELSPTYGSPETEK